MAGRIRKLSNISIDEVSLVNRGANQHALISIAKSLEECPNCGIESDMINKQGVCDYCGEDVVKYVTAASRDRAEEHGDTMEGGDYPIRNQHELDAAVHLMSKSKSHSPEAVRAHILKQAQKHNLSLPDSWDVEKAQPTQGSMHINRPMGDEESRQGKSSMASKGDDAEIVTGSADGSSPRADVDARDEDETSSGVVNGKGEKGETTPPQTKKAKYPAPHSNTDDADEAPKVGVKKDFWTQVVKSIWGDEVDKHFPPQQGPGQMPGQPMGQTAGAPVPVMGQPAPPPPYGGMPGPAMQSAAPAGPLATQQQPAPQLAQLPPEIVAYIQQLEAMCDAAYGDNDGDEGGYNNADNQPDQPQRKPFGKSGEDMDGDPVTFLEELAKSLDSQEQQEAVSKAMEEISKAQERAEHAEQIAKAERDLRLEREFVAKARDYSLPVKPEELGPVLKRLHESMSEDDVKVIEKCLEANSNTENILFGEFGKRGGGDNADVVQKVAEIAKSYEAVGLDRFDAIAKAYEENPALYDEYKAEQRQNWGA